MIPTRPSKTALLLTACLALTPVIGCGEDEDEEKFVDEANQVCRDALRDIEAAGSDIPKLISATEEFIRELKAVEVPSDTKEEYDAWVATQEEYFDELAAAARSADEERIDALDEHTGDEQARELGLDDCLG